MLSHTLPNRVCTIRILAASGGSDIEFSASRSTRVERRAWPVAGTRVDGQKHWW